ncbi:galactose ABC transporter substrate-binding protein [Clostridium sp. SHJSY1]|uniref:galactose ABC transporter substrate-binding protein n=1 Tax=Clostridium sp. SHJSY1 TaxID=2942483 RepID=UPI00287699A6|nr:galactose ABC transporter substrate-binding protein [Clostridium sp. SHJSY1]MDS0526999.1 galactose ABC transporter substrate-binding protein [Clostridium sp. SHJSY1]
MNLFKRLILFIIAFSLLFTYSNTIYAYSNLNMEYITKPINAAVVLFKFDDPYMNLIRDNLMDISKTSGENIQFTFFDGKNNQAIQNEILNQLFTSNFDLLLVNLVTIDDTSLEYVINGANASNKPVILFNTSPTTIPPMVKSYNKFFIISTDTKQSGILQGKLIVDIWNNSKSIIDKNNNNILEYVIIKGKSLATSTIDRTVNSISTIKNADIKTREIASLSADWSKDIARQNIEQIFLKYGNNIEAIISNNDAMAIGAIEALQKYGYNTENSKKNIIVVGIDGIPEAKELVNKGIMSGTVIQDPKEIATTIYHIGLNFINNKPPLENISYSPKDSYPIIEMPYYEYKKD